MNYTFYRIFSKNPEVKECYIGSTKDLNARKTTHKSSCNNVSDEHYNIKLYQFIRSNGGWDDFEFEIIDKIIFSETDRLYHEQKLMDLYASTLNTLRAIIPDKKEYQKEYKKQYYETHKEEIQEYQKEYKKQYYETNKEQLKEKNKQYREANKAEIKEHKKQYREANKEKNREYQKQYRLKKKQEKLNQTNI